MGLRTCSKGLPKGAYLGPILGPIWGQLLVGNPHIITFKSAHIRLREGLK